MRVLYGAAGEGLGHASRALTMAEALGQRGHEVQLATSRGRALEWLRARHPDVIEVPGYNLVIAGQQVDMTATALEGAARTLFTSPFDHVAAAAATRSPDVVVTDFCTWSSRFASVAHVPLLALDNIHFLTRCAHPREWLLGPEVDATFTYTTMVAPDARVYLVTTLWPRPVTQERTRLLPPVVRPEVLAHWGAPRGEHLVAYFNDRADWPSLAKSLERAARGSAGRRVHAYGAPDKLRSASFDPRPLEPRVFAEDLAAAAGVVAGAGFQTMSECAALGTPLLAVPFGGSVEQDLNARYWEAMGGGLRTTQLLARLPHFLRDLPRFADKLAAQPCPAEGMKKVVDALEAEMLRATENVGARRS